LEDKAEWEDDVPTIESKDNTGSQVDMGELDSPLPWWPSNSVWCNRRKAGLFRRLDAVCKAHPL
jgi:hypothetical protein